ncbi:hypothetical protein VP1G_09233 [Cytospora mali]|uniref:Pentatricopeptide repeat domain-containing protein n=1 Tax=Cytospora mali TaxID=578113 RepID=A0A194VEA7_CYTMA|nr:hypothetical protein VP1G_09233 [Valsa mali var. pyri (nom. inval.)]
MQSFLSRAAQAHVCNYRACAYVASTAVRPPTTAVNPRQTPCSSGLFAAFYTTISATASIPDVPHNDAQRKELSQRIERVRGKSIQLRASSSLARHHGDSRINTTRPAAPAMMRLTPSTDAIQTLISICKMEGALIRHAESRTDLNKFIRIIHQTYDPWQRLDPARFVHRGPDFLMAKEALEEEGEEGGILHREPLTNAQFQRYHEMINKLVDSLIIQAYHDAHPSSDEAARRDLQSLDSAWTAIRMLRSEGYPRYNHPDLDPIATKEARNNLRDMIKAQFSSWDEHFNIPTKFRVAKICYNLLVCPVPPSITHFNALILGFTQRKMHNLASIVVESLLDDSRLRPTPATIVCLLLHYQYKGDLLGFYDILRRMLAIDNRGMLIRRRWHEDVVEIPALRKWARQPEVTTSLRGNWVIERPQRNRAIYDALVSGLLYFGRVKDAAKVFVASLQEGWGTSVQTFIQLLRQCLYGLHAPAADILLRGFIDNSGVMTAFILRSSCPRKLAEYLFPLLNMGKPPSWPFSEDRASLMWYSKSLLLTSPGDRGRIERLTVAMFIRQTENQLKRLKHITNRIERIYGAVSAHERIVHAGCGVSELRKLSLHHGYLAGRLLKHQALLKISTNLEARSWALWPGELRYTHRKIVRLLEKSIPRPSRTGGWRPNEYDEEIMVVADQWLRYRLSRMHGLINEVQRTTLDVELALVTGSRLLHNAHRILFAFPTDGLIEDKLGAWKRWPIKKADAGGTEATEAKMTLVEGGDGDWPAPVNAWAAGPASRVI